MVYNKNNNLIIIERKIFMRILLKLLVSLLTLILVVVLVVVVLAVVPRAPFSYKEENKFRTTDEYPLIIPHGGAKLLAPENTIYSYNMLVDEFNAGVLEIDLALTKDDVLMAHHDLDLEFSESSAMNGKLIKDYTYAEIVQEYENDDYYLARNFTDARDNLKPFKDLPKSELQDMIPAHLDNDIFSKFTDSVLYILEIKDSPTSENYEEDGERFKL